MTVKELHNKLAEYFTQFFGDFNYHRYGNNAYFIQSAKDVHKMIFLNLLDYQDGLMIEFTLGFNLPNIEYKLSEIIGRKLEEKQHLTFFVNPDFIDSEQAKRSFLNPHESVDHYLEQMESFFVNKAFYWLDDHSQSKKLSDMLAFYLVKGKAAHLNLRYSAIRSLLLKEDLGEPITEDLFFTYFELMQESGVPESEIRQYLQLKKQFIPPR